MKDLDFTKEIKLIFDDCLNVGKRVYYKQKRLSKTPYGIVKEVAL